MDNSAEMKDNQNSEGKVNVECHFGATHEASSSKTQDKEIINSLEGLNSKVIT